MKHYKLPIIALVLFLLCVYFLTDLVTRQVYNIESLVGKNVVLQKDTLLITDYSIFFETYKLSNGAEISFKLAKELKQVP